MVEFALVLIILVMLLVGIVSTGIAYNHQLALTHGAREGGRYAATLPVTNFASMDAWLDEVATQVINDTTGTLGAGVPGYFVCVAYVHPNGTLSTDSTRNRIDDAGSIDRQDQPCFADGRPNDERRVQVEVRRDTEFNVVVFSTTINLDSEAVNRFEAGVGF